MAIVGGALVPPLMGLVSDASSINHAMLIPAACFVAVLWFALSTRREPVAAVAAANA
jgi:FHS family L-fucose permease-like MFS transporter